MAAQTHDPAVTETCSTVGLPGEIIRNILFQCSTPTFLQLTKSSKEFYDNAVQNRKILIHHLKQIPGDKANLDDATRDNAALLLQLRQRAANNLYGTNFSANMTEHIARNLDLDLAACSINGLDADYVRIALVHKHNTDIRQYTSHCAIKEKIKQPPGVKVLKLVQWGRFISALCAWPKEQEEDFSDDSDSDSSDSETEVLIKSPFPPSASAKLRFNHVVKNESKIGYRTKPGPRSTNKYNYRVCHYDVYTLEESQTFAIDGWLDYVPRDFVVHTCLQCAILWDVDNVSGRPTEDATVINYTANEAQLFYAAKYESKKVWPKSGKPERRDNESDDEDPEYLPERIEYFKEGRRIKMYDASGIVPYQVFSSSTTAHEQFGSTNVISFDNISFHVDTPFYGLHARHRDDDAQQEYCFQTHLCLGMSTIDLGDDQEDEKEVRVLCVLRSQTRFYPDSCDHRISLQRMAHVSAGNSTVVARLWGWEEIHTNLTGKEVISVSSGGTRIAIAMWDKVLIYALNPRILCEEVVVDSSDDEAAKPKKKKKKSRKPWETATTGYYQRKKDKNLLDWKIAELRPIVLDLEGAVAHKMSWSAPKGIITDTADPIIDDIIVSNPIPVEAEVFTSADSEDTSINEANNEAVAEPTLQQPSNANMEVESSSEEPAPVQQQESQGELPQTSSNEEVSAPTTVVEATPSQLDSISVASDSQTLSEPVKQELSENTASTQVQNEDVKEEQQVHSPTPSPSPATPATLDTPSETPVSASPSPSLVCSNTNMTVIPSGNSLPSNPPQTLKLSARKKEKTAEVINSEGTTVNGLEKDKLKSGYAPTSSLKHKASTDLSTPSSPVMNKTILKTKEAVSEFLSNGQTPLSPPVDLLPAESQLSSMSTQTSTESTPTNADLTPTITTTVSTATIPVADTKTEPLQEASDLSKTAAPEDISTGEQETSKQFPRDDNEVSIKRRKRISEDELVILTDRGIQVWNVGAKAKGIRKKKNIPMEERLCGKIPRLKQKVVETQDAGDVEE